jgi:DNA-binding response OmpR family regulator
MAATQSSATGFLAQFGDRRVLIVDSEPNILISLTYNLEAAGIRTIRTASDGQTTLELHEEEPFDLILLDNFMPRMRGPEVLRELRCRGDWVTVIMHTAWNREELDLDDLALSGFVEKPFSMAAYMQTIRHALSAPPIFRPPLPRRKVRSSRAAARPSRGGSSQGGKKK